MALCEHLVSRGEISNLPHQDVYQDHHVCVIEDAGCILAGKDVLQELQHRVRRLRLMLEDTNWIIWGWQGDRIKPHTPCCPPPPVPTPPLFPTGFGEAPAPTSASCSLPMASFCASSPECCAQSRVIRMAALQGTKLRPKSLALVLIIVYVSPNILGESSLAHYLSVPPFLAQQPPLIFSLVY